MSTGLLVFIFEAGLDNSGGIVMNFLILGLILVFLIAYLKYKHFLKKNYTINYYP